VQPCWRKRHQHTSRFPCVISSQVPFISFWCRLRDERRTRRTHSCSRAQSPCARGTLCKLTTSQPITTAIHPRSRSLARSSQSFVLLVNGTVPCCQLAPRQSPLVLFADIHACSLECVDQGGISTDFGHRRNEDRPHFSIARFWRAIFAASRHTIRLPPKHACVLTNVVVEIVRIGADALLA
jgi:hypothetical protein